jgi:hypothetical protein
MQVFTFFCVESDGSVPRFDVTPCADDSAARVRAFELLDMHHRCDFVEVWRGVATRVRRLGRCARSRRKFKTRIQVDELLRAS